MHRKEADVGAAISALKEEGDRAGVKDDSSIISHQVLQSEAVLETRLHKQMEKQVRVQSIKDALNSRVSALSSRKLSIGIILMGMMKRLLLVSLNQD